MSAAEPSRTRRYRPVFVLAALAFSLDVTTKILGSVVLAERSIGLGPVTFRLVRNPGIALGLGSGAPTELVIALTLSVTAIVIVMTFRGVFSGPAAGLVVGGAVGNLLDRASLSGGELSRGL